MTLNDLYSLYPEIQQKFEEFEKQENITYKDISSYLLNFKELQYTKKALRIKNNGEIAIKIAQLIHKDHYDYTYADFNDPNQKTKIICNYCGEEIYTDFNHHILGKGGCRKCNNPRKITTEIFIERANKVHNNKYDYSKTIYKNLYEPVIIICSEEDHGEYLQKPSDHLAGCGCQKCHPRKVKRTYDQFVEEARALHGDKYDYSKVVYIDCCTAVEIIYPKHGSFWQKPTEHLDKKRPCGCPYCSFNRKTYKEFIDLANELHNFKYQYNLEYTDEKFIITNQKIEIICPIHGPFWQTPINHIYTKNGLKFPNGCPMCREISLAEKEINNFLTASNISFTYQKTFGGCVYKKPLVFDFYLPQFNLCIEYQGVQHYKPIEYWGGEETFKDIQIRDQIKKDYCLENEIFLLEIPYIIRSKENIESYITYVLNNMKEGVFEYDLSNWGSSRGY